MRRSAQVKPLVARVLVRPSALSATAAARRPFPAWIDADERVVSFTASAVRPRIRDGLVLRRVSKVKPAAKDGKHDRTAR